MVHALASGFTDSPADRWQARKIDPISVSDDHPPMKDWMTTINLPTRDSSRFQRPAFLTTHGLGLPLGTYFWTDPGQPNTMGTGARLCVLCLGVAWAW